MIGWNLQVSNNRKLPEIKSEAKTERTLHPERTNHKVEIMTVNVGRKVNVLIEIERLQIAVRH